VNLMPRQTNLVGLEDGTFKDPEGTRGSRESLGRPTLRIRSTR
jgi:hypothetical protein